MQNILEIRNLNKQYPSFALKDISFRVPNGSIMGFIGENGAGKTTTIKLILNEIARDSGTIDLFGLDNLRDERTIKEQIGVVFDESYFYGEFTAGDISAILRRVFHSWDNSLYERYLKEFSLPKKKKIKEYSKGMKMKLGIASALAHKPRLLILDEATSGLDPVVRSDMLDIFLDFIQDDSHSILFSSHITSDIEKIADYVTFIHEGQIIFERSKEDLLGNSGIMKCTTADFGKVDKSELVRWRKAGMGYEALVADKALAKRRHPDFIVDNATIEEIMVLYVKGEIA